MFRSHSTARGRVAHLAAFFGRDARAATLTTYQIRQYQLARRAAGAATGTINRETSALHRMGTRQPARSPVADSPDTTEEESTKTKQLLLKAKRQHMAASQGEDRLRKDMLDDRRFRLGRLGDEAFQWPSKVWERRKSQGRPVLQTNRMPAFVALARNAVLSANLRPHVQPVDDKADVKTAEVISALIRNTEHLSQVEAVYSTAIDSMSENGRGYVQVVTEYRGAGCLVAESHNPSRPSRLAAPDGGNLHVRCDGRGPGLRAVVRIEAPTFSRKGSDTATPRTVRYRAGPRPQWGARVSNDPGLPDRYSAVVATAIFDLSSPVFFSLLQAIAVTADVDGDRVVEQAVEDGRGDDGIAKHVTPGAHALITGEDDHATLISA